MSEHPPYRIPYGRQQIDASDIAAVVEVLQGDWLTQGPAIEAFEQAFARYVDSTYAVAVSSGTAALHLSVLALGVAPGQQVITTPLTFAATANCVRYAGGQVALCDIDPATGLLDLDAVERRLAAASPGTYAGIIPVDYAGLGADMEAFRKLADRHGLWLLEDSCHAPGGSFTASDGQPQRCGSGAWADLAIFSFHPVKHIACGEGGMITTRDAALAARLRMLRNHGITRDPDLLHQQPGGWYYEMQLLGFNYRLTDIQAALGLSQLMRADANLARRRALAQRYDTAFAAMPVRPLPAVPGHAYHLYVVRVDDRKGLYDHLRARGVFAQVHYIPVHLHPAYEALGFCRGDLPHAEAFYDQCLSLPLYPDLSDEQQAYVIATVGEFVGLVDNT
ncbi:MAG: UDP-4-amino-4,6-dideoxy-N-acetyl-beta-L-altrosami ne transaminase [Bacteroidia bacterium]